MNENDRKEAAYLRKLSSGEAATFLIRKYDEGIPVTITRRSWKRVDQFRLARHFLRGKALAGDRGYKDFLSFMSVTNFLDVVEEGLQGLPTKDLQLLLYYLMPCLQKFAKTQKQIQRIQNFNEKILELRQR